MQSSITDFLKNTLSGDQENPKVATDAIIIPVGRRSTMSRARKQINDLFDRAEKALAPKSDTPLSVAKINKPRNSISNGSNKYTETIGGAGSLLGTAIGAGIGLLMGTNIASNAMKAMSQTISSAWDTVGAAAMDAAHGVAEKVKEAGGEIQTGWDWLKHQGSQLVVGSEKFAISLYQSSSKFVSKIASATGTAVAHFTKETATSLDGVFTKMGVEGDDSRAAMPLGAITKARSAIIQFWQTMKHIIGDWLNSIWGYLTGAKTDDATATPSASIMDRARHGRSSQQIQDDFDSGVNAQPGSKLRGHNGAPIDNGKGVGISSGAVSKAESDRAKALMTRLVQVHGWTPAAAAIAAGNAKQESSIRSNGPGGDPSVPGGSHGMFQWNRERLAALKAFSQKRGANWEDFDTQVDFFAMESEKMIPNWKKQKDLTHAGTIGKRFEGYGDNSTDTRVQNSEHFLSQFGDYLNSLTPLPDSATATPPPQTKAAAPAEATATPVPVGTPPTQVTAPASASAVPDSSPPIATTSKSNDPRTSSPDDAKDNEPPKDKDGDDDHNVTVHTTPKHRIVPHTLTNSGLIVVSTQSYA